MPTLPTFQPCCAFWAPPGDARDLPTGCTVKDLGEFRNGEISRYPHDTSLKTYKKHGIPNFFDMLSTVSQHFRKLSSDLPRGLMNVHLSRWKTINDMVCKQVDLVFPLGSFMQNTNFGWLVTGWTMERSVLAWLARKLVPSQLLKCWLCRLCPQALRPTCSFSKTSLRPVACGVLQHPSSSVLGKPYKINPTNFPMWKGICAYFRCISISSVWFIPSKHPAYTPAICSRRLDPSRLGQLLLSEKFHRHIPRWKNTPPTPPHLSLAIIPPTTEAQIGVQHLTKRQGGG